MSDEAKVTNGSNGHATWRDDPVERAVARKLGVSQTYLRRLVKSIGAKPFEAPDATKRYSTELVEQLRQAQAALEEQQEESDEDDLPQKRGTEKHLVGMYASGFAQAMAANERLINIICGPLERVLNTYNQHQERNDKRIAELERGRDEQVAARAAEMQAEHDRAQEAKLIDAGIARRDALFKQAAERLPRVFDALETSVLGTKGDELSRDTLAFLKSLELAQIGMLLNEQVNVTTPEQRALIRKIMKKAGVTLPAGIEDSGEPTAGPPTENKER